MKVVWWFAFLSPFSTQKIYMIIFSLRIWFGLFFSLLELNTGIELLERKLPVIRFFIGSDYFPGIHKTPLIERMVFFKVILIKVLKGLNKVKVLFNESEKVDRISPLLLIRCWPIKQKLCMNENQISSQYEVQDQQNDSKCFERVAVFKVLNTGHLI